MKKNKKGFTLIELLVVIAIIGLLSTLAVFSLASAREKARDAKRVSDLRQISTAIEMYFTEYSTYPLNAVAAGDSCGDPGVIAVEEAILGDALCGQGGTAAGFAGGGSSAYIQTIPVDPTNNTTYYYRYETVNSDPTHYCMAAALEATGNYFVCSDGLGGCATSDNACAEDGTPA